MRWPSVPMVRGPLLVLSTIVSIVLIILGGYFTFLNITWSVEWDYRVDVTAPDGVAWTLWIPQPSLSMPWKAAESVAVVGPIETPYGARINITGTGSGHVRFWNSTTLIGLDPSNGIRQSLSLPDREGGDPTAYYRVWRQSSDPSANLTVSGGLGFVARSSAELETCDGSGFGGHPEEEGWNPLPYRVGECVHRITRPPNLIPLLLIGPGSVLGGVLVAARRDPSKA
jgi:hypothetical protein